MWPLLFKSSSMSSEFRKLSFLDRQLSTPVGAAGAAERESRGFIPDPCRGQNPCTDLSAGGLHPIWQHWIIT